LLSAAQSKIKHKNPTSVDTNIVPVSHYSVPKYIQQQLQPPQLLSTAKVGGAVQAECFDVNCRDQCATSSWEKSFQAALMVAVMASTTTSKTRSLLNSHGDDDLNFENEMVTATLKNSTANPSMNASTEKDSLQQQVNAKTNNAIANSASMETFAQGKIGRPCSDCGISCVVLTIVPCRTNQNRLVCTKCRRHL
jgi:FlaG/FlaF family flagellin (archaellin)